jgi:hypothetical protein
LHAELYGRTYTFEQSRDYETLKSEIVDLSKRTNVLCPLTAFIGVRRSRTGRPMRNTVDVAISTEIVPPPEIRTGHVTLDDFLGSRLSGDDNVGLWSRDFAKHEVYGLVSALVGDRATDAYDRLEAKYDNTTLCGQLLPTAVSVVALMNMHQTTQPQWLYVMREAVARTMMCDDVREMYADIIREYDALPDAADGKGFPHEVQGLTAAKLLAYVYQDITDAQNTHDYRWEVGFTKERLGVPQSDHDAFMTICNRGWVKKRGFSAACRNDIPTIISLAHLYRDFGRDINQWRLSARSAVSSLQFKYPLLLKAIFQHYNVENVDPMEVLLLHNY